MPTIIPAVGKDPSVRIITLDFETYYDSDCSLKKLTYEEYIHHPSFYVMMVSIKINNGETYCVVGEDNCKSKLDSLHLSSPNTFVVGHNNRFDASILAWRFGIIPANICCTMLMSRVMGLARLQASSLDAISSYFRTKGYNLPKKGDAVHNMVGKHLTDISETQFHEYVEYCKTDTDICYLIFSLFLQLGFPKHHLSYIDITIKMYVRPQFLLDHKKLTDYVVNLETVREATLQSLANKVGAPNTPALLAMLRSKTKFQPLFREVTGRDLPLKVSEKKTEAMKKQLAFIHERLSTLRIEFNRDPDNASLAVKKEINDLNKSIDAIMSNPMVVIHEGTSDVIVYDYACAKTDLEFTALLDCGDPLVEMLVETKLGVSSSIAMTRATRFRDIAARMGWLPFPLEYASAHTSRFSGADKLNCQNLPARGDTTLRESMLAPEGHTVVVADSSQIEARALAYIAGEQWLIDVFATGGDPYSSMASDIYNEPYETIFTHAKARTTPGTPEYYLHVMYDLYRRVGKQVILGCIGEGTEVLTDRGWIAIETLQDTDLLWDGEAYVPHDGLVDKGDKETHEFGGVNMTYDHRVFDGINWEESKDANEKACTAWAVGHLPSVL